ncbi:hypothetical protein B0H13DRAFT_1885052 [Mycena leptocephala]|nr:hypothetical protein B0H13DRAFT_1885052 [Mycena leptocephala]
MCSSFDKPERLETIPEDREGETREELAKTTRIEEVRTKRGEDGEEAPQTRHIDMQEEEGPYTRANSPGASATPVRGVFQHNAVCGGNGANPNVPETHDDIGMWWALVEATEADRGPRHDGCKRVFSTGAGATPARGVQMPQKKKRILTELAMGSEM